MARARYLKSFNAVEIQSTFYEPPAPATAARWAREAPEEFAFTLKAWQLITHPPSSPTYRRLRTPLDERARSGCGGFAATEVVEMAYRRTMEVARALRARVVLFQTPASFAPTAENVARLRAFFSSHRPPEGWFCWEPRGNWPDELVARLCSELGLVHGTDPFVRPPLPGPVAYLRLHGRGSYRYRYTDQELQELARQVRRLLACREEVWCFFNNVWMAEDAARFRALMEGAVLEDGLGS